MKRLRGVTDLKVMAAWSGGKDSCFACYKAVQKGFDVTHLLTMMADPSKSHFHTISSEMLAAQSEAVGIPIVNWTTAPKTYEQEFKKALLAIKANGVGGLVTGDVYDIALHEEGWMDRVCKEVGLKPVKPLWHIDTQQILRDFIAEGFKATVVRVKTDVLGMEWLGREVDNAFFDDLIEVGTVDPCGERGEFHSFVTDGPLFKKRIEILEREKIKLNGQGSLMIKRFEIKPKKELQE